MKITTKQAHVLENIHRIVFVQEFQKRRPMLDDVDCYYQLIALSVKKIIRWDGKGLPVKIAEPDGVRPHPRGVRYVEAVQ